MRRKVSNFLSAEKPTLHHKFSHPFPSFNSPTVECLQCSETSRQAVSLLTTITAKPDFLRVPFSWCPTHLSHSQSHSAHRLRLPEFVGQQNRVGPPSQSERKSLVTRYPRNTGKKACLAPESIGCTNQDWVSEKLGEWPK